jgi:hypothetical protein
MMAGSATLLFRDVLPGEDSTPEFEADSLLLGVRVADYFALEPYNVMWPDIGWDF